MLASEARSGMHATNGQMVLINLFKTVENYDGNSIIASQYDMEQPELFPFVQKKEKENLFHSPYAGSLQTDTLQSNSLPIPHFNLCFWLFF